MTVTGEERKAQGNKHLIASEFADAIKCYTEAIELDGTKAVYYANRAQAYIKTEAFGLAIEDATKAIEIDPKYIKGYFRRAMAHTGIADHKEALVDYKKVREMAPHDAAAKAKLAECQKIIRSVAFSRAIEVDNEPGVRDTLDLASMKMDGDYDGPKLHIDFVETDRRARDNQKLPLQPEFEMTQEFIDAMIERFKNGKVIPRIYLYAIVLKAMAIFEKEPTMPEISIKDDEQITVCGDTHGQFFDFLNIFAKNGAPGENHMYLFNGDFVDRGSWSTEIAITLYAYKILYPTKLFINRGNHETDGMNKVYGFEGECKAKYKSDHVFTLFSESFSLLPLATLIAEDYLVLHGGLFSEDNVTLDDIRKVDRFAERQPGRNGLMMEMLWTDPRPEPGRGQSPRGIGIRFGPDVTEKFCELNNLSAVIRSHEVRMEGYSEEHNGRLITVFSAPNYCDQTGNKGSYINIGPDKVLHFVQFDAVPHPNVKSMAYASQLMA